MWAKKYLPKTNVYENCKLEKFQQNSEEFFGYRINNCISKVDSRVSWQF